MSDRRSINGRSGFLARLSMLETLVLAAICLVAIAGLMLVGKGFYMKTVAELPQMLLRRNFEVQPYPETAVRPSLAQHVAAAPAIDVPDLR